MHLEHLTADMYRFFGTIVLWGITEKQKEEAFRPHGPSELGIKGQKMGARCQKQACIYCVGL